MNVRLFSGRIATVILLCCILFIVCLPRDNIYDPANPEFVMPQFSGSVHLVDSATNNSITHATLYYSYDGLIDSAAVDTTGYALIQIRENSAGSRVEVRVNAIVSAMYVCSVPFSLSLYSEGRDTTIVMRDRSAGAVPWDSSLTHADVQGARLVWHSSDAEEFLYYLLVRIDPITGSGDTIEKAINRNDTSFTDSIVPENEVRMYRVDVVSTDGTVRSGPEYRVKLPNRNPAIANIISVDPDHFIFLRLSWQKNGNADFKQYVVYRSSDSISYTPVGTFASPEDTIWLDTTIDSTAQRYYYFIETVDTGALVSRSNVVSGINEAVAKDSLVYIRAGKFIMGRSGKDVPLNQQPAHTVYLSPYLIDRYEVTIALGAETDSLDADGEVIETAHVPPLDATTASPGQFLF